MRAYEIFNENAGDEYVYDVPVDALAEIYNPFEVAPWMGVAKIDPDDVDEAINNHDFAKQHSDSSDLANPDKAYHAKRIAYLVKHLDPEPIVIVPNIRGSYELEDGFHRLAAAIYRGDKTIKVAFGGSKRQLKDWLGL